jgi:hypothetical protein
MSSPGPFCPGLGCLRRDKTGGGARANATEPSWWIWSATRRLIFRQIASLEHWRNGCRLTRVLKSSVETASAPTLRIHAKVLLKQPKLPIASISFAISPRPRNDCSNVWRLRCQISEAALFDGADAPSEAPVTMPASEPPKLSRRQQQRERRKVGYEAFGTAYQHGLIQRVVAREFGLTRKTVRRFFRPQGSRSTTHTLHHWSARSLRLLNLFWASRLAVQRLALEREPRQNPLGFADVAQFGALRRFVVLRTSFRSSFCGKRTGGQLPGFGCGVCK